MPSTAIRAYSYDAPRRILRVTFVSGRAYDYLGVPKADYEVLHAADSKGRFVNFRIKPRYPYRRVN